MNVILRCVLNISFAILVDPCVGVTCSVTGESCVSGVCKCGSSGSCSGLSTGEFCDAANSVCKCTSSLDSCAGQASGEFCDKSGNSGAGECKCSSSVEACSGKTPFCYNGACVGGEFEFFEIVFWSNKIFIACVFN